MELKNLLRHDNVIAIVGLIITAALMVTETISSDVGITIIIGILVAAGAYRKNPPARKGR